MRTNNKLPIYYHLFLHFSEFRSNKMYDFRLPQNRTSHFLIIQSYPSYSYLPNNVFTVSAVHPLSIWTTIQFQILLISVYNFWPKKTQKISTLRIIRVLFKNRLTKIFQIFFTVLYLLIITFGWKQSLKIFSPEYFVFDLRYTSITEN